MNWNQNQTKQLYMPGIKKILSYINSIYSGVRLFIYLFIFRDSFLPNISNVSVSCAERRRVIIQQETSRPPLQHDLTQTTPLWRVCVCVCVEPQWSYSGFLLYHVLIPSPNVE